MTNVPLVAGTIDILYQEIVNMLNVIAFLLGVLGAFLVAWKKVAGFYTWIVSDILWIYIFGNTLTGYMFFVFLIQSVYSIHMWNKE